MNCVFGVEEMQGILGYTLNEAAIRREPWVLSLSAYNPFILNRFTTATAPANPVLLWFGLPAVAPALILMRTRLADQLFSMVLPAYFISPHNRHITWPPSPGLAFALMPYIRTLYTSLNTHFFGALEKKWDLAVQRQPREGETAEGIANDAAGIANAEGEGGDGEDLAGDDVIEVMVDEDVLFEVRIEEEEEIIEDENQDANAGGLGAAFQAGIQDGFANAAAGQNGPAAAQQPIHPHAHIDAHGNVHNHPPGQPQRQERRWAIEGDILSSFLGTTLMTSLLFPMLSANAGNALLSLLPLKYTLHAKTQSPFSILRMKWGRSLVGGCLLVVLRDTVLLYCKWKKARDFGKREVLDLVGKGRDGKGVKGKGEGRGEEQGNGMWGGFFAGGVRGGWERLMGRQ